MILAYSVSQIVVLFPKEEYPAWDRVFTGKA